MYCGNICFSVKTIKDHCENKLKKKKNYSCNENRFDNILLKDNKCSMQLVQHESTGKQLKKKLTNHQDKIVSKLNL